MSQNDIANILWFVAVELCGAGGITLLKKKCPEDAQPNVTIMAVLMVVAFFYLIWCLVR